MATRGAPKSDQLTFRVSPVDKKLIEDIAAENNISVSSLITLLVHDLATQGTKTVKLEVKLKTPHEKIVEGLKEADKKKPLKPIQTLTFNK